MTIEIPGTLLKKGKLTEKTVRLELAIILFKNYSISLGQAAQMADVHKLLFQKELAKRKIPIHYDVEDLEKDLKNIKLF